MNRHFIAIQEIPFYNIYKSEFFLGAICLSFCQVLILLIAYCLLLIAYCLLLIAYCLLLIAYCLLLIAYCLLLIAYNLIPTRIFALLAREFSAISSASGIIALL